MSFISIDSLSLINSIISSFIYLYQFKKHEEQKNKCNIIQSAEYCETPDLISIHNKMKKENMPGLYVAINGNGFTNRRTNSLSFDGNNYASLLLESKFIRRHTKLFAGMKKYEMIHEDIKTQYSSFDLIPHHNGVINLNYDTVRHNELIKVNQIANADSRYLNDMLVTLSDLTREANHR